MKIQKNNMKYKHFIFDIDGTLTESRTKITTEMSIALQELLKKGDVVAITGQGITSMKPQLEGAPEGIVLMLQSGNSCEYWNNLLTQEQKDRILHHIAIIRTDYSHLFTKVDKEDLIEDRGSQITFSFIGHHAELDIKKAFDPDSTRRIGCLENIPFVDEEICARAAGTTCIDYTLKNGTKGKNLIRLMKLKDWKPEDCVYIGDKISPNGNDGTVIGVIPNLISVNSPEETLEIIKNLYEN